MALIVMPVYDTVENNRTQYTSSALRSLMNSVDFQSHKLVIVDNNSCEETRKVIEAFADHINDTRAEDAVSVVRMAENVGTAEAWNAGARLRKPGEHVIKIDNDIVVNGCDDWVEQMEEVVRIDPSIGQVGLKRKDCIESVYNENPFYKSRIRQLAHKPGERWVVVEEQFHVMGSCVLHSSALLDKIGGMFQIGLYGFDDSFMSARCIKAGFIPVMLPHIDIDHIDNGDNPYTAHKQKLANDVWAAGQYVSTLTRINSGVIHYNDLKGA